MKEIHANKLIKIISEGSYDTEDWSNNAENSSFHLSKCKN